MYEISLFPPGSQAHETRNASLGYAITAENLAELISAQPWAPGLFKDATRSNKNLESISLLVLDFDEGMTIADAKQSFARYQHIIGTTKSHGIAKNGKVCDRFRVVLFLEEPATSDSDFKSYWYAAYGKWPAIDKQCKDSARFFYPCKDIVSINETGELFREKFVLPDSAKDWSYKATGDKRPEGAAIRKGKLSKATKDFLIDGAPDGEWHGKFFKAAMDFKEQGYSIEEAHSKLSIATGVLDETDEKQLADIYNNREPKYGPRVSQLIQIDDWPNMTTDSEGNIRKSNSEENVKHLLKKLGFELSFNEMDNAIYINGGRTITDEDIAYLWTRCDRYGLPTKKERFMALVLTFACENRFHPIKDQIESERWDGKDRITELFNTLSLRDGEAANAAIYKDYLRKWIIGVIAKLYQPGSQNLVLTLLGGQGIGKSTWLSKFALWPKAFGEGAIDPNNKDHELKHLTHMIWHIPELEYTTGKREVGALKDYLTRQHVSVRPAYARVARHGQSICSFCASVNADEFLVDLTGNRRFLVIPIEDINFTHGIDMQQVLAQAKVHFEAGEKYWLDREEIEKLNTMNDWYLVKDALVEYAEMIVTGSNEMTSSEILKGIGIPYPTKADFTRLGQVLQRKGIKRMRRMLDGTRKYFYMVRLPNAAMGEAAAKLLNTHKKPE